MGSILCPNCVIWLNTLKLYILLLYFYYIISMVRWGKGGMPWAKTVASHYHETVRTSRQGHAIKRLIACNGCDIIPLDLVNSVTLGCYQSFQATLKHGNVPWNQKKWLPYKILVGKTVQKRPFDQQTTEISLKKLNVCEWGSESVTSILL